MQFMVNLGFVADEVLGVAHDLYDSNDPNKLSGDQKKRVQLALEERKKKEVAA
jgi:ABC-type lipoprotein export system ATPase subunit